MCPLCISQVALTSAMLIAGSVTSMGGLAAIAIKKLGVKNAQHPSPTPTKEDHHG
jgi:hypothetical protein